MNTTHRNTTRAAAIAASAAFFFGAAACGTDTGADSGQEPAAPAASTPQAKPTPHAPTSADAAERRAAERHSPAKYRRQFERAPGSGREIPSP